MTAAKKQKITMARLYRLENIESYLDFLEHNSIQRFTETFCNETLSRVYRLVMFSKEINASPHFLYNLQRAIERESFKRNFDCFKVVKQNKYDVLDVIYHQKDFVYLTD